MMSNLGGQAMDGSHREQVADLSGGVIGWIAEHNGDNDIMETICMVFEGRKELGTS